MTFSPYSDSPLSEEEQRIRDERIKQQENDLQERIDELNAATTGVENNTIPEVQNLAPVSDQQTVVPQNQGQAEVQQQQTTQSSNKSGWDEAAYQRGELNEGPYWDRIDDKGVLRPVTTSKFVNEDGALDWDKLDQQGWEKDIDALAGIWDFMAPIINRIPGITAKPLPKFENEVAQTSRDLSALILPNIAIGGLGAARLGATATRYKNVPIVGKALNTPFAKWAGETSFMAGTGAVVDYVVPQNQEDDNLAGVLKERFPRSMGWIPNSIATTDLDTPDQKRWKNVLEGTYLGFLTDLTSGAFKFFGAKAASDLTEMPFGPIPESQKSANFFDENIVIDANPEEAFIRSALKREEALDELGSYNLAKSYNFDTPEDVAAFAGSADLDEPTKHIFGYHDTFGYQESGIRSVDDLGIVGASIDSIRIRYNAGTVNGRLGSVVSDAGIKFMNAGFEEADTVLKSAAQALRDADAYGWRGVDGTYFSHEQILEDGIELANSLYRMDIQQLRRAFEPGGELMKGIDADTGVASLSSDAYHGVMDTIRRYMDDFINMDEARARAYISTSFAGQVSDMAQGMRLTEGSGSLQRVQDQILERVQFLMSTQAQTRYIRGRSLSMLNLTRTERMRLRADKIYAKQMDKQLKNETNKTLSMLDKLNRDAADTVERIRAINESNPEMLGPLMMAYELTDGNVDSLFKLNQYVKKSTSIWSKAFVDLDPDIPSVINRAFYANIYNSVLSSGQTLVKAGASATQLLVTKPVTHFGAALLAGDGAALQRAFFQYEQSWDTMKRSLSYMNQIWKRSALDPGVVPVRDDVYDSLEFNARQMELLNATADAFASRGEFGPQMLMEHVNTMNDLANHPWSRFGTRSMQALDGFVQSVIADFEAKGRAFDKITADGTKEFTKENAYELAEDARKLMFDDDGVLTDEAVRRAAGEISLNLDTELSQSVSALVARLPILKPFLLFTKTPINELQLSMSYSPTGLLASTPAVGQFLKLKHEFRLPYNQMDPEHVEQLLTSKGIDVSDKSQLKMKYNEIFYEMKGRQALGMALVGTGVGLFMNDRLTGAGHYNREVQATRDKNQWPRNSFKWIDDKWYSYEGLGPITNTLSLIATIGDNFDVLGSDNVGELYKRLGFSFAAVFKDKALMAGVEPFFDIFRGDQGAINRWSSAFLTSATIQGSSQLNELGRLLDPEVRLLNNDLSARIAARLPFVKSSNPSEPDWIEGGPIGVPDSIICRMRNTYTPWKCNGSISPRKQFQTNIEYNAIPQLATNGHGEKLDNIEQAAILNARDPEGNLIFQPMWAATLDKAMEQWGDGTAFRNRFREGQDEGLNVTTDDLADLHRMLDAGLNEAIKHAYARIPQLSEIDRRQHIRQTEAAYIRDNNFEGAKQFMDDMKKEGLY